MTKTLDTQTSLNQRPYKKRVNDASVYYNQISMPKDEESKSWIEPLNVMQNFGLEQESTPQFPTFFERIHLSQIDGEIIESFYQLCSEHQPDNWIEEKLFDILCLDFGAQAFLQYAKIFKV